MPVKKVYFLGVVKIFAFMLIYEEQNDNKRYAILLKLEMMD